MKNRMQTDVMKNGVQTVLYSSTTWFVSFLDCELLIMKNKLLFSIDWTVY